MKTNVMEIALKQTGEKTFDRTILLSIARTMWWTLWALVLLSFVLAATRNTDRTEHKERRHGDLAAYEGEATAEALSEFMATPAGARAYTEGGIMRCRQAGWDADKCFTEVCRGHDNWRIRAMETCEHMITDAFQ